MESSTAGMPEGPYPVPHACCLYETDGERRRQVVRFLLEGIRRGEGVVWVTRDEGRQEVLQDLLEAGTDPAELEESGQLVLLGSRSTHLSGDRFDPARALTRIGASLKEARAGGRPGVRIAVDVSWFQEVPDAGNAYFQYETELNRALREHRASALCLFQRRALSSEDIIRCLGVHASVWTGGDRISHTGSPEVVDRSASEAVDLVVEERRRVSVELEAAKRAARLLDRTLNVLDAAVLVMDAGSGRILECNRAAETLFGWARDDLLGRVGRSLHVDEADWGGAEESGEAPAPERREEGEFVMRRADGSAFPARVVVSPLEPEADGRARVLGVIRDISREAEAIREVDESEARFRQIAERIDSVFWIRSADRTRVEYVSPAYEAVWGRSTESLRQDPSRWIDTVHAEDRERVREALTLQGDGEYREEYRILRPDGEIRWIADRSFPVRDDRGELVRFIGVARDVTERRELEAQLRQSQKMEAIGRLAGGVAHDFNNLLSVIAGHARILGQDVPWGSPPHQEVQRILGTVESASALTRQLLAFSRTQVLEERVLDLAGVVREMEPTLRRVIPDRIELRFDAPDGLGLVEVDPHQLHRVVLNLALNAADAIPGAGRISFTVDTVPLPDRDEDGDEGEGSERRRHIRLTVRDTGSGMPPEVRERMFEPFYTTKPPEKGSGLGLSTVFGIVKQSGGWIEVESEVGVGTSLTVGFPEAEE